MTRKSLIRFAFSLALLTLVSGVAQAEEASCLAGAKAWLLENGNALPTNYDELLQLGDQERRIAFGAIAPATQASIWRSHFESYVALHEAELTRAQLTLLDRATALATERLFRTPASSPSYSFLVKKPLEKLLAQAYELFSDQQIAEIFYQPGSPAAAAPATKLMSPCNCSDGLDCYGDFGYGGYCSHVVLCWEIVHGCGPYWIEGCDGRCSY